jgi:hypothetical protein
VACCGPGVIVMERGRPSDSKTAVPHHRISSFVAVDVICAVSGSYQAAAMDNRTCACANRTDCQAPSIPSRFRSRCPYAHFLHVS